MTFVEAYALIMAGGGGTRLWPSSRRRRPKQLLTLGGTETLLAATVRRAEALVGRGQVLVVTAADQESAVREDVPHLAADAVIVEPEPRNTTGAVALGAAAVVRRAGRQARMAVLPADPFIGDEDGFRQVARRALEHAGDAIVAIGVKPTHPETGFGYIRAGAVLAPDGTRAVEAFVEKPSREVAETYLASGNYYWNAGMFFLTAGRMGDECRLHLPAMAEAFEAFVAADDFSAVVRARYGQVPAISIDYGIMEKARGMKVVPGAFGWNDVGSWAAVHAIRKPDAAGNVLVGDVTAADAKGNLVVSEPGAPLVSVVGVQDLVVVATADAVLVVPRDRAQDVRLAVEALKKAQRNSLL